MIRFLFFLKQYFGYILDANSADITALEMFAVKCKSEKDNLTLFAMYSLPYLNYNGIGLILKF